VQHACPREGAPGSFGCLQHHTKEAILKTEYRIILTATFETAEERDKMYSVLKDKMLTEIKEAGIAKRADMTKDDYFIPDQVTEKVI
jgi:proline dehydrogenase